MKFYGKNRAEMSYLKKKKLVLALNLSLVVLLAGCAGLGGEKIVTPHNSYRINDTVPLDNRQRADLYEAIIAADMAEHQQDHQTAMSYYLYAAELSKNKQIIDKSVDSAIRANDSLGMEQAAKVWLLVEPESVAAKSLLLKSQILQQNAEAAFSIALELMQQFETSETRFRLIEDHIINQDPRLSINLMRDLKERLPEEVAVTTGLAKFIMTLANVNQRPQNMLQQALAQVNEALKLNPKFTPAIRIKSHILFQLRKDDEARVFLSNEYFNNPDSAEISQMLGQLLYDLHDFEASSAHFHDWLAKHPDDLEARFYLAASYYALEKYSESLRHFVPLVNASYKLQTTAFYCGDSAYKLEQYEQALACLRLVTEGRFWTHAKIESAQILAKRKKLEQAINMLNVTGPVDENNKVRLVNAEIDLLNDYASKAKAKERLSKALQEYPDSIILILKKIELHELSNMPEQLLPVLEKARALFEPGIKLDDYNLAAAALLNNNGHIKQAVTWLDQAIENKPDDKDLLYTRAIYKEPLGLYDDMVAEFKHLHELYPDDLNIQNALGYTLADQGIELDYAKSLIDNAFKGLPNNAAIIDSKGWVAFRMGELPEAILYLTQAFKMAPSADVAAHLGEALWQDNKKELAKKIWRKGMELDAKNPLLIDTLKRFKVEL